MRSAVALPVQLRRAACLLFVVIAVAWPAQARAATAEQVNDALDKAKDYIYKQQKPDGTWEDSSTPPAKGASGRAVESGQWGGQTALATYALLAAGENAQEPKLAKAIEFLKKHESGGVYALGLRMQVWLHLPQNPDVVAAMKRDAAILLKSTKSEGSARGMYNYTFDKPGGEYSHSRAQYGVLGMWAAEQMGFEVPANYWLLIEQSWIGHQDPSGGWTYKKVGETPSFPLTPGMTAAGVATLFITQDYVHAADGIGCRGNLANLPIEKGLKWMGENMDKVATNTKYERDFPYITLYAVERIGLAGGIKYLGNVDWYQKGADWLLAKQSKTAGGWGGSDLGTLSTNTCFAMLFLARGRNPVAFNKLDYSDPPAPGAAPAAAAQAAAAMPWNQRPRDVANVTRWLSNNLEVDLNWQVVSLKAPASELLDAPILYISGSRPLTFSDEEKGKLRQFVEMGGLILGNADCANAAFATSFTKLGQELFPAYEFRELPDNHPIYESVFPRRTWRVKPSMQGISNGARELMLLVPTGDPARFWQLRTTGGKEEFWQMAANIFLYQAAGKDLRYRGDTHWVNADPKAKATHPAKVYRIEYNGNWDPEPGGWRRLVNVMQNEHKTALTVEPVKLGEGKLVPSKGAVAHMTGTANFTLNPQQQAELKAFVTGGGTLVVDAAGGSNAFATAAEQQLAAIFPGSPATILPPDHALYANARIEKIAYRPYVRGRITGALNAPRLRAIDQSGRAAVIFSGEDLSVGLVGHPVDAVMGYSPDTATELMAAAILHANPAPKPTSKPATKPATKPTAKPTPKLPAPAPLPPPLPQPEPLPPPLPQPAPLPPPIPPAK